MEMEKDKVPRVPRGTLFFCISIGNQSVSSHSRNSSRRFPRARKNRRGFELRCLTKKNKVPTGKKQGPKGAKGPCFFLVGTLYFCADHRNLKPLRIFRGLGAAGDDSRAWRAWSKTSRWYRGNSKKQGPTGATRCGLGRRRDLVFVVGTLCFKAFAEIAPSETPATPIARIVGNALNHLKGRKKTRSEGRRTGTPKDRRSWQ